MATIYDIANAYKMNSGTKKVNSLDIANQYVQSADYFNQQKANAIQGVNSLLQSKYGSNATYNNGLGMYQNASGQADGLWDTNAVEQYKKYIGDIENAESALAQANTLELGKNQALAEQSLYQQQAQKYIPGQLALSGMGNVGSSESTLAGIANTYARNTANINNATSTNIADLYKQYNQAQAEGQTALDLNKFDNEQKNVNLRKAELENLVVTANSIDAINEIEKTYGADLDDYSKTLISQRKSDLALQEAYAELNNASTPEQYQAILEKYSPYLSEVDKTAISGDSGALTSNYNDQYVVSNFKGIDLNDPSKMVKVEDIGNYSFGDFYGASRTNSNQNKLTEHIKTLAEQGLIPDGTILDVNYGGGQDNWVYYKGKFYKTTSNISGNTTNGWRGKDILKKKLNDSDVVENIPK